MVEAQPDLSEASQTMVLAANPSEKNGGKEDPDNPPKDNGGNSESPSTESQLPPKFSESHSLDDPALPIMAPEILLKINLQFYILYFMETLYITSNRCWKFVKLV